MLELNKVTKYYKNEKVLDEITMTIKEGEFVSLLGPSGCGKSTLVHIISGLNQASDGEVSMDGRKITRPSTDRIMVFQSNGLFPWLTVEQNVAFGKKDNGNKISKDEVKKTSENDQADLLSSQISSSAIRGNEAESFDCKKPCNGPSTLTDG